MYVINIVTPTRAGDTLYNEVAINTFPIVWMTDSEDISELWSDNDFILAMERIVKSHKVYENAVVYYRCFTDEQEYVREDKFKLKEKINLELK